jgi:hypothetical protein
MLLTIFLGGLPISLEDRTQIDSNISNGLRLEVKEVRRTNRDLKLIVKLMNVSMKTVVINRVVVTPEALSISLLDSRHKVIHYDGDSMALAYPDRLFTIEIGSEIKFERQFHLLGKRKPRFITATTSYPPDSRFPRAWSGELVIWRKRI